MQCIQETAWIEEVWDEDMLGEPVRYCKTSRLLAVVLLLL